MGALSVAWQVLRDMQELERHPIMRIALEADKRKFDEAP
jgi:hypothetical protein